MWLWGKCWVWGAIRKLVIWRSVPVITLRPLVSPSMELHKAQLEVSKGGSGSTGSGGLSPSAIPLAQLLKNPQALSALSSLTGLQGLSSLTSLLAPDSSHGLAGFAAAQRHNKAYQPKLRAPASAHQPTNGTPKSENKRSKFAPY